MGNRPWAPAVFRRATWWLLFLSVAAGVARPAAPTPCPAGEGRGATPTYYGPSYEYEFTQDTLAMSDGVRLAVSYWRPVPRCACEKFPVVLEMLPYRKDDSSYMSEYSQNAYLARRGLAAAQVDVRGTGSSEGRLGDREYSNAELRDIQDVIELLAHQPWCNGRVGMIGMSWSAFNGIMTAMRRPPHLGALYAMHGSEDIYGNDIHYIDGALHLDIYSIEMETENPAPRAPDYRLDEAYFRDRFDAEPWILTYLRHQRDGEWWEDGRSLDTDYAAVDIPVFVVGGLLDGYRDFVPHMLENMGVPMRGEIGTWNHDWPVGGAPGPNYESRQTAVRWFHRWLNGHPNGVMDEPRFTVFVRGSVPASPDLATTPGEFRAGDWPFPGSAAVRYYPQGDHSLQTAVGPSARHALAYRPGTGTEVGNWWGEATGDMRGADAASLVYDSPAMEESRVLVGIPKVRLAVACDAPLAHWMVRLEDVHPDGSVSLVTGGLVNGAQRRSRTEPEALVPGQEVELLIPLRFTTWTFEKGHRIRLAVTNAQFPMIWPTPYPMTTTLVLGGGASELELPFVLAAARPRMPVLLVPEPVEEAPDARSVDSGSSSRTLVRDNFTTVTSGEFHEYEVHGRRYRTSEQLVYRTRDDCPAESSFRGEGEWKMAASGRVVQVKAEVDVRSDATVFHVAVKRRLYENGALVREKEWQEDIPRDFQ